MRYKGTMGRGELTLHLEAGKERGVEEFGRKARDDAGRRCDAAQRVQL